MSTLCSVIDLEGLTFDEQDRMSWLQALPIGTYEHPLYGTMKFTPAMVNRMVQNFQMNVRGIAPDIDYDHKEFGGQAAGWVVDAENRGLGSTGGLWIRVEWTPSAYQALAEKQYRYFSPEFSGEWVNPRTQVTYRDVLFGGAITNRPFLKDIQPINLSELQLGDNKGDGMDEFLKQLAELLGIKEGDEFKLDAPEDAQAKLLSELKALKDSKVKVTKGPEGDPDGDEGDEDELKKLSESNPTIAKLLADRETDRKALKALEAGMRLSEVKRRLGETKTDKWMLPPAFTEAVQSALVAMPMKLSDTLLEAMDGLTKSGLVPLTVPAGAGHSEPATSGDPVKAFTDRIEEYMKAEKCTYPEAAKVLSDKEPEMWAAYEGAVLAGTREEA